MSTEDGAPGVGSRWRVPSSFAALEVVHVGLSLPSGIMIIGYTVDGAFPPDVHPATLDDWRQWVASGRVVPVKEEVA